MEKKWTKTDEAYINLNLLQYYVLLGRAFEGALRQVLDDTGVYKKIADEKTLICCFEDTETKPKKWNYEALKEINIYHVLKQMQKDEWCQPFDACNRPSSFVQHLVSSLMGDVWGCVDDDTEVRNFCTAKGLDIFVGDELDETVKKH